MCRDAIWFFVMEGDHAAGNPHIQHPPGWMVDVERDKIEAVATDQ